MFPGSAVLFSFFFFFFLLSYSFCLSSSWTNFKSRGAGGLQLMTERFRQPESVTFVDKSTGIQWMKIVLIGQSTGAWVKLAGTLLGSTYWPMLIASAG